MAEIKTAISIVDNFTPVLRSLTTALNVVVSSLADTQQQLSKPIDLSSLNTAKTGLSQASEQISKIGDEAQIAATKQRSLNDALNAGAYSGSALNSAQSNFAKTVDSINKVKDAAAAATTKQQELGNMLGGNSFNTNALNKAKTNISHTSDAVKQLGDEALSTATKQRELNNVLSSAQSNNSLSYARQELAKAAVYLGEIESKATAAAAKQRELNDALNASSKANTKVNVSGSGIDEAKAKLAQTASQASKVGASFDAVNSKILDMASKIEAAKAELNKLNATKISQTSEQANKVGNSFNNAKERISQTTEHINRVGDAATKAASKQARLTSAITATAQSGETLSRTQSKLSQTATTLNTLGANAQSAAFKQRSLNSSMRDGAVASDTLLSKIKALVAAYATFQTAKSAIKLSDELSGVRGRLSLMVEANPMSLKELDDTVFNAAQRSGAAYLDMMETVSKLSSNTGKLFKDDKGVTNFKEVVHFSELLTKQLSMSNVKGAQLSAAMLQLTQAMASGVLQGDEFKSIGENAPIIKKVIADYMKVSEEDLRELSSKGKITAEIIKNAFLAATDDINDKFSKLPDAWSTVFTRISNYWTKAYEPVSKKLEEAANSQAIQKITTLMVGAMSVIVDSMLWAIDAIGSAVDFIIAHLEFITPVVYAAAAAFVAWGAGILFAKVQAIAAATWQGILTAATIALTFATKGAAAGFAALNATMAMNPIMFIIYAVIILIAVFHLAVAAINYFTGSSYNATAMVAGFFTMLYATIFNIVAGIYNAFMVLGEFLINVFKYPIYSVKALFVNLATTVLDLTIAMISGWDSYVTSFVNMFLEGINWVIRGWNKLIDILPSDVTNALGIGKGTEFKARASITSDLTDAKKSLQDMLGDKPDGYTKTHRLEYKNVTDYYNKGYKVGEDFSKKFDLGNLVNDALNASSKIQNGLTSDTSKQPLTGFVTPKSQSALDKIADNTGKMKDSLTGTDEELKYLREIGEREAVYKLNTSEIKVSVNNNNSINSALDIDAVVGALTNKIREAASVMAEGYHT